MNRFRVWWWRCAIWLDEFDSCAKPWLKIFSGPIKFEVRKFGFIGASWLWRKETGD